MLPVLLSLTAFAEEPAATPPAAEVAPKTATIEIGTIDLNAEIQVPEVVIFTPKIKTQESTVEELNALIDTRLAEAEARR